MGICDVQTEINPLVKDSTFVSTLHLTDSRINDFFMYNKDLRRIRSCKTGPGYMELHMNNKMNPLSWRLNSSILKGQTEKELQKEIQIYLKTVMEKFLHLYYGMPAKQY